MKVPGLFVDSEAGDSVLLRLWRRSSASFRCGAQIAAEQASGLPASGKISPALCDLDVQTYFYLGSDCRRCSPEHATRAAVRRTVRHRQQGGRRLADCIVWCTAR